MLRKIKQKCAIKEIQEATYSPKANSTHVQVAAFGPRQPEMVASRFQALGTPGNWNSAGEWKSLCDCAWVCSFSPCSLNSLFAVSRLLTCCLRASTGFDGKVLFLSPANEFFVNRGGLTYVGGTPRASANGRCLVSS